MSLIAGSYERFIWGFNYKPTSQTLTPLFSFPSHQSPIKSAAVSGAAAATGGADDTIKLYDLSSSAEIGSLLLPSTVTSLSFFSPLPTPRNLFAADTTGNFHIFDADPFVLLKTLRVHKSAVNAIAVHPSGRVGLSVGRDEGLAMVNLVRGRRSFYCRLGREAGLVGYCDGGDRFFMVMDKNISVHQSEDAKIVMEMENDKGVLCATPGTHGVLLTGGEDKSIKAWDITSGKVAYSIEGAHSNRVKGIVVLYKNNDGVPEDHQHIVASASSDGVIRVWDIRMANKEKPNPLAEANTKSRLTCLAGSSIKSVKRPQVGNPTANGQQQDADEES